MRWKLRIYQLKFRTGRNLVNGYTKKLRERIVEQKLRREKCNKKSFWLHAKKERSKLVYTFLGGWVGGLDRRK